MSKAKPQEIMTHSIIQWAIKNIFLKRFESIYGEIGFREMFFLGMFLKTKYSILVEMSFGRNFSLT